LLSKTRTVVLQDLISTEQFEHAEQIARARGHNFARFISVKDGKILPTPPPLMMRNKDRVELAANEVRAKRIRVVLVHLPECCIDQGQCDCQLELLLLEDLDRGLLWRLEKHQRVLVSFGENRCRICGEAAAWCYQQQDEDTIEMCRLCSRLFETR
jgi:hypothetical protein